eukprot:s5130_g1.t1
MRKVDNAGKLNELMTVHRKEKKNAPMNREWPPDVNSNDSDEQNSQMSGAAQSAAGHADVPRGPSGAPSKFVPATPDVFQPPPGAFYPEEFKRQAAEFNRDCASPVTGPWKAAPEVPPIAIRTANYDPKDDPWCAEDGPLELNPNAIRLGQRPVLELYGKVQQQSREAAEAAARAAQLAAQRAAAQQNSSGFPKARGSSSASAAEQHLPKASAAAMGSESMQKNLQLPVDPRVKAKAKAAGKVARIAEEPDIIEGVDRAELLDEWEEFSVVSETEDSPPWFPNYPAGLPSTFKWGPSWEESDVLVDLDKVDLAIPKSAWVHSTEQWSRTIITMPKYRAQKITFLEFTKMVAKYAKKLIGKYRKLVTACPRSQAPDLAAWCLHVRMDAFLDAGKSYRREFAEPADQ